MDHQIDVIDYLNRNINEFQKSDALLARYILKNRNAILKMTVTELAEKMDLSDATVVRFCQKIGFKGYYQMKIMLAQSLRSDIDSGLKKSSVKNPVLYVSNIVLENIAETRDKIDLSLIDRAAELISAADCVYFFAAGNSYPIAFDAAYKLSRIGIRTFNATSPEVQIANADFLSEKSVAFGVSYSGASKVVLKTFEIAKEKNANIILLSNYEKSPLAKLADVQLITREYKEYFLDSGLVTRICSMYMMDVLFFTVLTKRSEEYARLFQEGEDRLSEFTM